MSKSNSFKQLSNSELTIFCDQMYTIIKSGIFLHDGLLILLDDTKDLKWQDLLKKIIITIDKEKPLYIALKETGAFSDYFIGMIKVGELTGKLDTVFLNLKEYYEDENTLQDNIKHAISHPLMLIIIMSIVISVIILKVIPVFKSVYSEIGNQIDCTTESTINFAIRIGVIILIILAFLLLCSLTLCILMKSSRGRSFMNRLTTCTKLFHKTSEKIALSRFASLMSLMISSGIETEKSLAMCEKIIDHSYIKSKISVCHEKVVNHIPFEQAIIEANVFSPIYNQIIRLSYKSGKIDKVWEQISDKYKQVVTDKLNNTVSFIEPLFVCALSVTIGIILLSIMLPLMSIISVLG